MVTSSQLLCYQSCQLPPAQRTAIGHGGIGLGVLRQMRSQQAAPNKPFWVGLCVAEGHQDGGEQGEHEKKQRQGKRRRQPASSIAGHLCKEKLDGFKVSFAVAALSLCRYARGSVPPLSRPTYHHVDGRTCCVCSASILAFFKGRHPDLRQPILAEDVSVPQLLSARVGRRVSLVDSDILHLLEVDTRQTVRAGIARTKGRTFNRPGQPARRQNGVKISGDGVRVVLVQRHT